MSVESCSPLTHLTYLVETLTKYKHTKSLKSRLHLSTATSPFKDPPHASGFKVSCRRSHHHLSRRALSIDCGSKRDLNCTRDRRQHRQPASPHPDYLASSCTVVASACNNNDIQSTHCHRLSLHHQLDSSLTPTVSSPSAYLPLSATIQSHVAKRGTPRPGCMRCLLVKLDL
jgi:hypothetical protein